MQTVADMRGVGVKNREKFADVLCGRPLTPPGQISSAESFDSHGAQGWNKRTVCNLIMGTGQNFFGEK